MADPQKVNKWVKFVGTKVARWKDLLDDINVDQVPLQYVVEVRYHHTSGEVNTLTVNSTVKSLGDDIGAYVRDSVDLKAVEFIVDIDRINTDIGEVVKNLLSYSQDDK